MELEPTPSQTVGPYFTLGLEPWPGPAKDGIELSGRVLDGAGEPVPDAVVELWQADSNGRYSGDFGWSRCGTHEDGSYTFTIVKPGRVGGQAPHVTMLVFARGLLKPVLTRLYFPDEGANAEDPVLRAVDPARRETLIASADNGTLHFDVRLQGDDETVFFAV